MIATSGGWFKGEVKRDFKTLEVGLEDALLEENRKAKVRS